MGLSASEEEDEGEEDAPSDHDDGDSDSEDDGGGPQQGEQEQEGRATGLTSPIETVRSVACGHSCVCALDIFGAAAAHPPSSTQMFCIGSCGGGG